MIDDLFFRRGAVLIMGAVTLNVWASALLYHPVEWHMVPAQPPDDCGEPDNGGGETASVTVTSSPEQTTDKGNSQLLPSNNSSEKAAPIVPKSASSVALEYYKSTPMVQQGRARKISMPTGREISGQMHSTPTLHAVPERGGVVDAGGRHVAKARSPLQSPSASSFNYISTPYHGSTLSALHPERASTLTLNAISNTFSRKGNAEQKRRDGYYDDESDERRRNKFFDFSLLKDPIYLVILISNCTNAVSYTNFVILLPAYAISLGYDKSSASLLLSIVSMLDLVGRIGGSALSDIKIMPKHWYFVGGLLASGISLAILPTSGTYTMLSVYCGFFGLASGIYVGITAVIMADMLGTEKLTSSYGISLFVNGVIQLVGPPICGIVFEQIGSYGPIFSILGIILVFGASLWVTVPFIRKRQAALDEAVRIDKI